MKTLTLISTIVLTLNTGLFASKALGETPPKTADDLVYSPILNEKALTCAKPTYCRINEPGDQVYLIWFDVKIDSDENLREIVKINIKNSQSGEVHSYQLEEVARVEPSEPFQFFKVQLRKDGPVDLALFSFQSLKDGELFYYFLFNPKTKKFELTRDQIPRLRRINDGTRFVSEENSNIFYDLNSNLRLNLNIPATKAAHKKVEEPTSTSK
jgi:hypothetical protein